MNWNKLKSKIVAIGAGLVIIGCGGGGKTATVSFALTTTSAMQLAANNAEQNYKSVKITVEKIEVHGDGWLEVPLAEPKTFDLMDLPNGLTAPLGELKGLDAGKYTQIRLFLSKENAPKLILADNSEHTLTVPSSQNTGLKIITPFEVAEGEELHLGLEFDVNHSIVEKGDGSYILKPVIKLIRLKSSLDNENDDSDLDTAI